MKNKQLEPPKVQEPVNADTIKSALTEATETLEEGVEKIDTIHHWLDDIFSKEQSRLAHDGVTDARCWVEGMACIDKSLSEHPVETLTHLANVYGVTLAPVHHKTECKVPQEVIQSLQNLEHNQQQLWHALQKQSQQTMQLTISNFVSAKDDEGKLLHPHFSLVKKDMFALLESGVAFDFETAYEKALWLNPQIREQLIDTQSTQNLQTLAEEASKAKTAGFSPKGKLSKEDYSQMTTREILERKFQELKS